MKYHVTRISTLASVFAFSATAASAGTIVTSVFSGATASDFSISGATDWGYVENGGPFDVTGTNNYSALNSAVVSGSHTAGDVVVTNGGVGDKNNTDVGYSVDGTTAYGAYGGLSPTEDNAWTVTFNNLVAGENNITLFLGHSDSGRSFDIDASLTDSGGNASTTTTTGGAISGLGGTGGQYFKYDLTVTATDTDSTVTLDFGSTGGGFGEGYWAGYTLTAVPEASTALLLGVFGGLFFIRRRR